MNRNIPIPITDDLRLAADWLEANEGGEAPTLARVAVWLRAEAAKRDRKRLVRRVCTMYGCTPARARRLVDEQVALSGPGVVTSMLESYAG